MIHILSYVGMSRNGEVCIWTLLGLLRCMFDATSFKFNTNLKQVWHMSMPAPLPPPVWRVLRTVICGIMLVQYFTVYAYLASYIILLYPVFLEERSTLVLPWLLLTALRQLLCELLSLAMGLAVCAFLGAGRTPCVKFVLFKILLLGPWLYVWMLLFDYYNVLKAVKFFKTSPEKAPAAGPDYAIELAVRRRCTKSLLAEDRLRRIITATFYGEDQGSAMKIGQCRHHKRHSTGSPSSYTFGERDDSTTETQKSEQADREPDTSVAVPTSVDAETCDDWLYGEITIPRDTDRVLEQFSLMMLRLATFIDKEDTDPRKMFTYSESDVTQQDIGSAHVDENNDTPPQVGSMGGTTAAYLRDYPNIFKTRRAENTDF